MSAAQRLRGSGAARAVVSYDALVPAWFIAVGAVAVWWPPPTLLIGATIFMVALVGVPVLVLTLDIRRERRLARLPATGRAHRAA